MTMDPEENGGEQLEPEAENSGPEGTDQTPQPEGQPEQEFIIRRILVALDASPHSVAALYTAAELAEQLDAELLGLFVEDIHLIQIADLPSSRHINIYSATPHLMGRQQMEQELRAQATQARRLLTSIARRSRLTASFRVTRGLVLDELLQATVGIDLIILGKAGWSQRRRVGSIARSLVFVSPSHALVIERDMRLSMPLGVLYDGTPSAQKALDLALQLSHEREDSLWIIILADTTSRAQEYHHTIEEYLKKHEVEARYSWLVSPIRDRLYLAILQLSKSGNLGGLLLPSPSAVLSQDELIELMRQSQTPILFVR